MQNIFLKIGVNTNPISGESVDKTGKNLLGKPGHEAWVEVLSFTEGVTQTASPIINTTGGKTKERCQHDDFTVTKYVDAATPLIHQWCSAGTHIDKVIVEVYRSEAVKTTSQPILFLAYIMKDVVISRHQVEHQAGDLPIETVKFNYGLIYTRYIPQSEKAGASASGPVGGGWDVLKNEPPSGMP